MKKIFLLDDDEFVTSLYKTRLQNEGFQVEAANHARDALVRIEEWLPDLLILDLHMPEISGVDVLRALRASSNTRLRTLAVVVLSSGHVQELLDTVSALGVQKIFVKMQSPPNTLIAGIKEIAQNNSRMIAPSELSAEEDSGGERLPELIDQFSQAEQKEDLHSLLLEIYRASWGRIRKGLRDDETSPRGKLSRALQKLIQDLYDHPEHITPSTQDTLGKALKKLMQFDHAGLSSELALRTLLDGLGD